MAGAQVDLNPHQVDAALFAFKSPLERGAILADEVGLGKTIEAGLVIAQKWAQRNRRILIITPANLRKQWQQELKEKFFLSSKIIDSESYNHAVRLGSENPFSIDGQVVITSYQFANAKNADIVSLSWDLVVIDEAHRLRNVYKSNSVIASNIRSALQGRPKLLLTATPLQNSLLELYGLASFVDEHVFGDLKSFRERFSTTETFELLRARLRPICHRTLRRQVAAYVPYTRRLPLVEEFSPGPDEQRLYELVSEYLRRPQLYALPNAQRTLMTLVLRKLLASSTFAIAGALTTMATRLRSEIEAASTDSAGEHIADSLGFDYEALQQTAEEWLNNEEVIVGNVENAAMHAEVRELEGFATLATSIQDNAKGRALLKALEIGMSKAHELGADPKAIIFTESRRTQDYLLRILSTTP